MDELRERVVRNETNHENLKDQFLSFKQETKDEFKSLSLKIDFMVEELTAIRMTIAKWLGGGAVLMAILEVALKYFMH